MVPSPFARRCTDPSLRRRLAICILTSRGRTSAVFDLLEAVAHGNSTAKDCKSLVYQRCGGPDARGASGPTCPRAAPRRRTRAWAGHRAALGPRAPLCGHTSAREPEGPAAGGRREWIV